MGKKYSTENITLLNKSYRKMKKKLNLNIGNTIKKEIEKITKFMNTYKEIEHKSANGNHHMQIKRQKNAVNKIKECEDNIKSLSYIEAIFLLYDLVEKKPIEVESYDFSETKTDKNGNPLYEDKDDKGYLIKTIEGMQYAGEDDFIIDGIDNDRYPINRKTYFEIYDLVRKEGVCNIVKKRPIVVKSYDFSMTKVDENDELLYDGIDEEGRHYIKTDKGELYIGEDYFIIKGIDGTTKDKKYPIKADIYRKSYKSIIPPCYYVKTIYIDK